MHIEIEEILRIMPPGTEIPKPAARSPFRIVGTGKRRGLPALIYEIPNRRSDNKLRKGINQAEFDQGLRQLEEKGQITRDWFNKELARCAREGGCNYTTLGGILVAFGMASYDGKGIYRRATKTSSPAQAR